MQLYFTYKFNHKLLILIKIFVNHITIFKLLDFILIINY
jgi:hypothetical protein